MKSLRSRPITPRIRLETVDGREVWELLLSRRQKSSVAYAIDCALDSVWTLSHTRKNLEALRKLLA